MPDYGSHLNRAEVASSEHTKSGKAVRVDGGAIWSEVDRVAMAQGLATCSESFASSGVAA